MSWLLEYRLNNRRLREALDRGEAGAIEFCIQMMAMKRGTLKATIDLLAAAHGLLPRVYIRRLLAYLINTGILEKGTEGAVK